ncbi:PTS sugar transporter subunit IIA [Paucilactobacillus nenjiangensis]|uniref:PTS sugar transporter subunit IIA n=1 Tax=Paucilactobacillus nenjiangensis TaxID=1296540 RepID=UPI0028D68CE2|nr:PTS sugar transporter subunit IIA [Paucilactobacillus nenjiangensis]
MTTEQIISEDNILVNLRAKNKLEIITALVDSLVASGKLIDNVSTLEAICARENEGITGIGNGIAIPHGQSEEVNSPCVAVATLANPIDWGSIDENPVVVVFLFVDPLGGKLTQVSEIIHLLGNDESLRLLKAANSVEDVLNALK